MEINKIQKKGKELRAQNGPARPSSASRPAQRGLPRRGLAVLQKGLFVQKLTNGTCALFI